MFSKTCEYAIKAVLHLATTSQLKQLASLNEIAEAIDSPTAYTAKILQQLAKADIIQSVKGHAGGYFIADNKLSQLYLSNIVDVIDGDSIYLSCALGLKKCSTKNPCPLHDSILKIRNDLQFMLQNTSIKNLANDMGAKHFSLK